MRIHVAIEYSMCAIDCVIDAENVRMDEACAGKYM